MTTLDALRAPVQEMLRTGRSTDDILAFLRKSGCSKIDCLAVLEDFAGMDHAAAKAAVHFSPVWAERREADEQLHDALERKLRNISHVNAEGLLELNE